MNAMSAQALVEYWSSASVAVNVVVFLNLLGALLLGMIVGYERAYHGRAAGMRTYGIVCMASAALTVFAGYPEFWFGGHFHTTMPIDPTRAVQGIVTGVGFLGAGLIMKEGMNISGLTTAASIWASSAIGVLVGVGFYFAAILLTLLSAALMMWGSLIEGRLPSRHAIALSMRFTPNFEPQIAVLRKVALSRGYEIASGSFAVSYENEQQEWNFVAVALARKKAATLTDLADELARFEGVEKFQIKHARN